MLPMLFYIGLAVTKILSVKSYLSIIVVFLVFLKEQLLRTPILLIDLSNFLNSSVKDQNPEETF